MATKATTTIFSGRLGPNELKAIIHEAEEGGYWAEIPAVPGCATQGETFEELLLNIYEAVEACLSVDVDDLEITDDVRVMEIADIQENEL
jgi:predicted RNase H-like HicB family nuclease